MKIVIDAEGKYDNSDFGFEDGFAFGSVATLDIARKLKTILENNKCEVYMTREGESRGVSMNERVRIIKEISPDWVISIKVSSFDTKTYGVEGFYRTQESKRVLESVLKNMGRNWCGTVRGVRFKRSMPMLIASNNSIIVSCGYMDNRCDKKRLIQPHTREKYAEAIAEGFLNAVGMKYKKTKLELPLYEEVKKIYNLQDKVVRSVLLCDNPEDVLEKLYLKIPLSGSDTISIMNHHFGKTLLERIYGE